MGLGGQHHVLAALSPGKRNGTHFIGGSVRPRAGLDGWQKSRPPLPPRGLDRRTVQPLVSRFTNFK